MTPLRWAWTAFLLVPVLLGMLILVGCTTADPSIWIAYKNLAYTYGRIEAKAELHCAKPVKADRVDICREAAADQAMVRQLTPMVDAELSKPRPDWPVIMQWLQIILGVAGKFVPGI